MTQVVVSKVSEDSLNAASATSRRDRTDPEHPDFTSYMGRELTNEVLMEIERDARELRARVIGLMFRRMGRAIERALWRARQRDVEKYLAKAVDHADLERRMREIEYGRERLGGLSY